TFTYDAAGQHLTERTVQRGTTYQNNQLAYDTLGRLALVDDGHYRLTFEYDKGGNRIHEQAHNDSTLVDQDLWYAYDHMNRETGGEGVNNGGTIDVSVSQGHRLTYDLNGNRTSDYYYGVTPFQSGTDESGNAIFSTTPEFVTRNYTYDAQNRLTVARQ